tara:strand:- start:616 stop:1266 length:651 start_codon:yes stop_codon:yes gene_type:complete
MDETTWEDLDKEYWKKIEGYNYYVSTEGRVRNKDGLIMKQHINKNGYYRVYLYNKKHYTFLVSRLVAKAFIPNLNNLPEVHHKNKNKLDNRICNLMWVTTLENCQSINKTVNIGCVVPDNGSYKAKITIYKKKYYFYNTNEDKCWDWLYARRIEIEYGLNLTELDITKYRKRGLGTIKPTNNGRVSLDIVINKVRTCKTFDTYEEAEDYVKILKSK